jgi:flagella basal body P-ring formation protein FlgA
MPSRARSRSHPFRLFRRRLRCGSLALAVALTAAAAAGATPDWQSPASIRQAAERHALETLGRAGDASVESVAVDDRLKLPSCDRALTTATSRPFSNGRGTVTVSCEGSSPWRLFVPVRATQQIQVVVAIRPIQRDELIAADDVALEWRASTSLPYQYATRIDDVVGHSLRRSILAGAVLAPAALERQKLVDRGAIVTLTTNLGSVSVKAEGVALEQGAEGQRIRLKTAAGRVIEGTVVASNEVRVGRGESP